MRKPSQIEKETVQIATVKDLTSVFESLASTQVAKIKNKAILSQQFFQLLWQRYSSLRTDPNMQFATAQDSGKKVFIIISAEGGLSGDIDQRLIETMIQDYDAATTDLVVLGSHGASQLRQRGISYVKFFKVPESDRYINVTPVINAVISYSQIIVYYEEYVSLSEQIIKKIDLATSMQEMTEEAEKDTMTPQDTIFEPSPEEIADQMEVTMMDLALSQSILESGLAQAASRFNAMAVAKKRAGEILDEYMLEFHRAKRGESDRRMREVMVSLKKKQRMRRAK
jgi:F-type H+-transporting ATPase subunit gamma